MNREGVEPSSMLGNERNANDKGSTPCCLEMKETRNGEGVEPSVWT